MLDVAHLDASGRFTSRPVMCALGWQPGQQVEMSMTDQAVLFTAVGTGRLKVGRRGELAVPAPARVMAGLDRSRQVVLLAMPSRAMLIMHPPALVAGLLADHYAQQPGDP